MRYVCNMYVNRNTLPQQAGVCAMKGPFERIKYDLRRVWECPVCHHKERKGGQTTAVVCLCQLSEPITKQQPMHLIDDHIRRKSQA